MIKKELQCCVANIAECNIKRDARKGLDHPYPWVAGAGEIPFGKGEFPVRNTEIHDDLMVVGNANPHSNTQKPNRNIFRMLPAPKLTIATRRNYFLLSLGWFYIKSGYVPSFNYVSNYAPLLSAKSIILNKGFR